ncbi:MAG: glycosyltransferase family 4 protein [Ignavibacteriae bacterium]|nr:glycosyltransferase family 4 protein [Ignavibacteriota bacterium]
MSRRIRVAHLITNFAFGGAQDYLLLIVRGLDQTKFEPIVAGRMEGDWAEMVQSLPGVQAYDIPALCRPISLWNDAKSIFQIKKFCEERKVEILHTHSSKAGVVGRLGGSFARVGGIVHTVHGFSFNEFMPPWTKIVFVGIEKAMSRFTTSLLLYSNGDRETARKLGIGARRSVETFYYGIDFSPFERPVDRAAVRRSLGFNDRHKVIGFTGRFSDQKGLHILVEAFACLSKEVPNARLLLVGDGHLRGQLEIQARSLGVHNHVVITGFRSDVPAYLAAMDLFAMTSLWEGLSRSLAEAMYAKLPVIATDVGGTSDAIRNNETGWLIKPNSVNAAVEAMEDALSNPDKARRLAECGYQWARRAFDMDTMHKRIAELYEQLAEGTR